MLDSFAGRKEACIDGTTYICRPRAVNSRQAQRVENPIPFLYHKYTPHSLLSIPTELFLIIELLIE